MGLFTESCDDLKKIFKESADVWDIHVRPSTCAESSKQNERVYQAGPDGQSSHSSGSALGLHYAAWMYSLTHDTST